MTLVRALDQWARCRCPAIAALLACACGSEAGGGLADVLVVADSADAVRFASGDSVADGSPADAAAGKSDTAKADSAQPDGNVAADAAPLPGKLLVLNEIACGEQPDWVEVYNLGSQEIALNGWTVTDNPKAHPDGAALPNKTTLKPGAWLALDIDDKNAGFALGQQEMLQLRDQQGFIVDEVAWQDGDCSTGTSYARLPDGFGLWQHTKKQTPGAANK
jgi:hypothetical protein